MPLPNSGVLQNRAMPRTSGIMKLVYVRYVYT